MQKYTEAAKKILSRKHSTNNFLSHMGISSGFPLSSRKMQIQPHLRVPSPHKHQPWMEHTRVKCRNADDEKLAVVAHLAQPIFQLGKVTLVLPLHIFHPHWMVGTGCSPSPAQSHQGRFWQPHFWDLFTGHSDTSCHCAISQK